MFAFTRILNPTKASYLFKTSIKLYCLRKIIIEKLSHLIESPFKWTSSAENQSNESNLAYKPSGLKSIALFQCIR